MFSQLPSFLSLCRHRAFGDRSIFRRRFAGQSFSGKRGAFCSYLLLLSFTFSLCCLLLPLSLQAQENDTPERFLTKLAEKTADVSSFSCSFEQQRFVRIFSKPVTFYGQLTVSKPDKIRWQVLKPLLSTVLIDGTKGLRCNGNGEPFRFDLQSDPTMQVIFDQFTGWMKYDFNKLQKFYSISLPKKNSLELVPRQQQVQEIISSIRIDFSPDNMQPNRIEIAEQGTDRTILTFGDYVIAPPVSASYFSQCSSDD